MSGKVARSFSIDEDIKELLSEKDDLNPSAAVNEFLREFVASGRGTEAALEVRLNQLDEEIADLRRELGAKERERERVEADLDNRRSELQEQLREAEKAVRNTPGLAEKIDETHDMIQHRASEAGIASDTFLDKLEARL